MNLYRGFRDPQSAMNPESKQFPFMAIGPVSLMPFAGQPMFFSAFNGSDFAANNVLTTVLRTLMVNQSDGKF